MEGNILMRVDMLEYITKYLMSIHKEGYIFIAIFSVVTLLFFSFSNTLGWLGIIATLWCLAFFRDPERVTPIGDHLVISPADGKVDNIVLAKPPKELDLGNEEMLRISIFLSVFDVHVNRIPVSGTVEQLSYNPGKFFNASLDKASEYNERQSILVRMEDGTKVGVVQIAGLIARRIVCYLNERQDVKGGERFGIIRFGSRVDVYLPKNIKPLVAKDQYMIGGETILARTTGSQEDINTEVR
jgi:phosphatidylserine decarboxylase